MLRKHVARFGVQWDQFYQGFCGHEYHTTQDEPLFPLFGVDSSSPIAVLYCYGGSSKN